MRPQAWGYIHEPNPDRRRQRQKSEARPRRAAGEGLRNDRGRKCGRRHRPRRRAQTRPHPDGHSAPRDERHRGAQSAARGRLDGAHSDHRRDSVGDAAGPQPDHRGGLRRLYWQAHQPQGIPRHRARDRRTETGMSGSAKVLVVDDTPHNVKLLADLLGAKGYAVATAVNGEEALAKVASEAPDLILLDVMMPGLSGYDVCKRLRQDPLTALLPIVLVTSLDPQGER